MVANRPAETPSASCSGYRQAAEKEIGGWQDRRQSAARDERRFRCLSEDANLHVLHDRTSRLPGWSVLSSRFCRLCNIARCRARDWAIDRSEQENPALTCFTTAATS